jgi:XTP/dITP diphosphohydrolase
MIILTLSKIKFPFFVFMKLIFATNNQHKAEEMRYALRNKFEILTLKEAGIDIDVPEPHDSLEKNASEKSGTIYHLTKKNCFSEDTGLEVYALNGEPGVKSARYAGDNKSFNANIEKLLGNLAGNPNRKARFRAIISLIIDEKETLFEGICEGKIINEKKGSLGFGYDPIFVPNGATKTFAEMSFEEKNKFSHRTKAAEKLVAFLTNLKIKA